MISFPEILSLLINTVRGHDFFTIKQSEGVGRGNLSWFYFTSLDQLKGLNSDVNIAKWFFRYDSKQKAWDSAFDQTIFIE